jgi:undecaprenyl-diphosphatase
VSVAALAGLALAVAFTRLYLGRHYLTDVVAGLVLGGTWAWSVTGVAREAPWATVSRVVLRRRRRSVGSCEGTRFPQER